MYRGKVYVILILIFIFEVRSAATNTFIPSFEEGKMTIISTPIDLKGEEMTLPKNVTLKFEEGGCLMNGIVTADNTSIVGNKFDIFTGVTIAGKWNVQYISTDMFKDISELNSLQNVFALASDQVSNVITIQDGNYLVEASRSGNTILKVPSNTEVIINGTITMRPNDFTNYNILELSGENIRLHGTGEVIGDKYDHTGTEGEWGMGVSISQCNNVYISDLTIKDCWGDCIYICAESTDIRINNCSLDNGRRQGISITSAGNILIENCVISNVGGTSPGYAIDVEPNINDTIESVIIRNVKAIDCNGGFMTWGGAEGCLIKDVELYDCYVKGASKVDYYFNTSESIKLVNCTSDGEFKPINNKCKSFIVNDF